jgi:hypothetical protein
LPISQKKIFALEPALSVTDETWHSAGSKSASVSGLSCPVPPDPQSPPPVTRHT